MSVYSVSSRFATALLQSASEKNISGAVSADVELISQTITASKELRNLLASPVLKESKKAEIIEEIFKSKVSADSLNFLKFVIRKNRENLLHEILKRFIELWNSKNNILSAKITSAYKLEESEKKHIAEVLEKYTGKKIQSVFNIDQKIIGGFVLKIGDTVIDGSVANQLLVLKKKLLEENLIVN